MSIAQIEKNLNVYASYALCVRICFAEKEKEKEAMHNILRIRMEYLCQKFSQLLFQGPVKYFHEIKHLLKMNVSFVPCNMCTYRLIIFDLLLL